MNFYTIRHPPVDRNGLCIGQTAVPVTISRADAVSKAVSKSLITPKVIISSDLPRCANLAFDLSEYWQIPIHLVPALREMNFGEWEGRNYDDIDREDGTRWREWCTHWQILAPPGGESLSDMTRRIKGWLQNEQLTSETLVVTHAGVLRTLEVLSGCDWNTAMQTSVPFLGWKHQELDHSTL